MPQLVAFDMQMKAIVDSHTKYSYNIFCGFNVHDKKKSIKPEIVYGILNKLSENQQHTRILMTNSEIFFAYSTSWLSNSCRFVKV